MVRRMLQLQEWWHDDKALSPSEEDANARYRSLMIKLGAQVWTTCFCHNAHIILEQKMKEERNQAILS